jgi:hypothetical protein
MSDPENRGATASSNDDADQSGEHGDSILDALDMKGVEDIEILFDRPVTRPRPARFQ